MIVDDHPIVRKGLQVVLGKEKDFEVVGEAVNGQEAVTKAIELSPDLVLMDLRMPEVDGVAACRQIKLVAPHISILIFTAYSDEENIFEAFEAGVDGYLLKNMEPNKLIEAVRLVCQGHSFLHPHICKTVLKRFSDLTREEKHYGGSFGLTSREMEILILMAEGFKNREIASKLWVSEGTVKTHVSNILKKLNKTDRAQAIIAALQLGLIKIDAIIEGKLKRKLPLD